MKSLLCFVMLLGLTGCGQKMVTLNLKVAMPEVSKDTKSMFHPIGPAVGFCKQDSLFAAVITNPRTSNEQVINQIKVPIETNFPDWNGQDPISLSEILSYLISPHLRYGGSVQVQVPANTPVEVGIVGKLMLGVSSGAALCDVGNSSSDWRYVGIVGSAQVTPTSNTSLSVPAIVSRKVISTTCADATECTSANLATQQARNSYIAMFISLPSLGVLSHYSSANVVVSPENSNDPSKKITYNLKNSNSTNMGSILPGGTSPATFATSAFAIPNVFPMELVVEGTAASPPAPPSTSMTCKITLTNDSMVQRLWTTANHTLEPDFHALVISPGDWSCN